VTVVRVGLVGLGNWGGRLAAAIGTVDGLEVTHCFARSPERRKAFADAHGIVPAPSLTDLLRSDIDGIVIATPHSTHADLVVAAADAGKHVMVEKPLTLNAADARRCVYAAARNDVRLHVAHYRRRLTATRMLKAAIEDGRLGAVLQVDARFNRSLGRDIARPWRDDPLESPAGALTALGIHMIDNFLYLAGPIRRVTAVATRPVAVSPLDDLTVGLFEFDSGAIGTLATSLRLPFESTCAVYGTEAAAWSEADGSRFFLQRRDETARTELPVAPVDGIIANLDAFAECVRTGVESETGGAAALEVVRVFEAVTRSATGGGIPIDLEEI
jgi:predicted dehydrogenase